VKPRYSRLGWRGLAGAAVTIAAISLFVVYTRGWWLPRVGQALAPAERGGEHNREHGHGGPANEDSGHDHSASANGGHSHAGHDEASSLTLSEQARKNIGLTLVTIELRDFERTISVPATLVDQAARTEITVSAPMTGTVTRVYPIRGEAVVPGDPIFDLRLTHEDLVEKQISLLRALEELDVVKRQAARLEDATAGGAVAPKLLLERQYEQQKMEAGIRAEKQALLLHGLNPEQVRQIEEDRQLLQELTITAPPMRDHRFDGSHEEFLQVAELAVKLGDHVQTGTRLATLTDRCELYIEGKAFEQDANALNNVASQGLELTALVEANGSGKHEVPGLKILYVENEVERESRALKFYVPLPNELVRNEKTADGHRFIGWRYKPGQRVELLVPIEHWKQQIVLPREAVVQEGAESYVYQYVAGHFDRKSVHVEHGDQRWAVIQSDGTLFPGDEVAASGAYQIHLALKNKTGGGPDPHAGHHH
jgi:multidrug efflux pump subunit AcrA (membrane-fusion protein)